MAAAAIPLALQLLPLLPPAIAAIADIIEAVRNDPAVPTSAKLTLDSIYADLTLMRDRVAAVELPAPGSGA